MTLLFVLACTAASESDPLLYDAGRSGLEGALGPWGVHLVVAPENDPPTDLYAPVDAEGAPGAVGFAAATLVIVQDEGARTDRYAWLGAYLASRGATVIVPHHGLELPGLDQGAALRALVAARAAGDVDESAPVGVLGHGVGASVAAAAWAGDDAVEGLALLGGVPFADTNVEARETGSVVLFAGSDDEVVTVADAEAGADRFNLTHAVVAVPGLDHDGWLDAATDSIAEARAHVQWGLAGWVDSCVTSSVGTWPFYAGGHPDDVVGDPCDLMVMGE